MRRTKPDEPLIQIKDVPAVIFELTGVLVTRHTVYNWIKKGKRNYEDDLIKLSVYKGLRHIFTTRSQIIRFIEKVG